MAAISIKGVLIADGPGLQQVVRHIALPCTAHVSMGGYRAVLGSGGGGLRRVDICPPQCHAWCMTG